MFVSLSLAYSFVPFRRFFLLLSLSFSLGFPPLLFLSRPLVSTALQHTTTYRNTLQHIATHYNISQHSVLYGNTLQHTAIHCNTLQYTASHCNTLQRTAIQDTTCFSHSCNSSYPYPSFFGFFENLHGNIDQYIDAFGVCVCVCVCCVCVCV